MKQKLKIIAGLKIEIRDLSSNPVKASFAPFIRVAYVILCTHARLLFTPCI